LRLAAFLLILCISIPKHVQISLLYLLNGHQVCWKEKEYFKQFGQALADFHAQPPTVSRKLLKVKKHDSTSELEDLSKVVAELNVYSILTWLKMVNLFFQFK